MAGGGDQPSTVTLAPGATGGVPLTMQWTSPGGSGTQMNPPATVVLTAPGNSTFAAQTTMPVQYSTDGSTWVTSTVSTSGCVLSNSNMTLTCTADAPVALL